jgi:SAM-dependent methyltransferase
MKKAQTHTAVRRCPICRSNQGKTLGDFRYALFDDLNISGDKTLVQCSSCGLMYDDTRLTDADLARYYARNDHSEFINAGSIATSKDELESRLDRIVDQIVAHIPPPHKVLDVGCNRGGLLIRCRERGLLETAGIELCEKAREAARDEGLRVVSRLDELAGFKPDIIVFSHIIEHLLEPMDILGAIVRFAPGAYIYIEVPATETVFLCEPIEWSRSYFEHITHFTEESLKVLCRACGIAGIADGRTSGPGDAPSQCHWIVGQLPETFPQRRGLTTPPLSFYSKLPLPGGDAIEAIPEDNRPVAIWGVSQYAMLLLGSRPELARRVKRLFDVSPAKVGRSIRGITIEHSRQLSSLTKDDVLVLPKSTFLQEMRSLLPDIGFKGLVLEV